MTTMLSCHNLWKVFGASKSEFLALTDAERDSPEALAAKGWIAAVRNASFDIARGEVFVIMGLSGSGKSTLVRCLSRLIEPSLGSVTIDGQDLLGANEKDLIALRRRLMSMVFQHFALLPNRTVLGNVAFPLQIHGTGRTERELRARDMIDLVGLAGREDHFPNELSGGQQQRVGIARSLASDPAVWFLDEPFSALDPLIRADLQDELLRLQKKLHKTIIFITHDLDEAIKIADRIAIMENGEIVQTGSPDELVLKPATEYVARFVRDVPKAKVIRVEHIMDTGPGGGEAHAVVDPKDTVEAVAKIIIAANCPVNVVDHQGRIIGHVKPEILSKVLAGLPYSIEGRNKDQIAM
ncbi:MAG: betaine/proline/choline family ABC transporter ATP-binding protein [Pseudomonadota bacterium]